MTQLIPIRSWRRVWCLGCLAGVLLLQGGCRLVGKPGDVQPKPQPEMGPEPEPELESEASELELGGRVYHGSLGMEGGEVSGALEIAPQGGPDVLVALQTISGLKADGRGTFRRGILMVTLEYGGDCPGQMTLEGPWDPEVGTYSGSIRARDCTGEALGTFRFGYNFDRTGLTFLHGEPAR